MSLIEKTYCKEKGPYFTVLTEKREEWKYAYEESNFTNKIYPFLYSLTPYVTLSFLYDKQFNPVEHFLSLGNSWFLLMLRGDFSVILFLFQWSQTHYIHLQKYTEIPKSCSTTHYLQGKEKFRIVKKKNKEQQ